MGNGKKTEAVGHGSARTKVQKINICPLPEGCDCEQRDPEDYNTWGKHQYNVKVNGEIEEKTRQSLIEAHTYNITYQKDVRKVIPDSKGLKEYRVETLQVAHMGEKVQDPSSEIEKSTQSTATQNWRYIHWEYKKPKIMDGMSDVDKKAYWYNYFSLKEFLDTWSGDEKQQNFSMTKYSQGNSLIEGKPEVSINDQIIQRGYEINTWTGEVSFTEKPPSKFEEIKVRYTLNRIAETDSKQGASLEYAASNLTTETIKGNGGKKFDLTSEYVIMNSVEVKVEGKPKHQGSDFLVSHDKSTLKFSVEFMKPPAANEKIEIGYRDSMGPGEHYYEEVELDEAHLTSFENSKRTALESLEFYLKLFNNAKPEFYKKSIKGVLTAQNIKDAVEAWDIPFPCRKLEEKGDDEKVTYIAMCQKCGKQYDEITLNYGGLITKTCDNFDNGGNKCGGRLKITNWLDIHDHKGCYISWDTDLQLENELRSEIEKTCDTEPFAVFFQVDKPKLGVSKAETESEILNSSLTPDFKNIAEKVAMHIRKVENTGEIAAIKYWGYADKTGKCNYNLDLSLRRAKWVQSHIEHMLKNDFNITAIWPGSSGVGCGEHYAALKEQAGGYNADEHRVVIIEFTEADLG